MKTALRYASHGIPHVRTVVLALVFAAVGATGVGATSSSAPPAGLSIALTDHAASATAHSRVTYTATLANAGQDTVTAWIVIAVPAYGRVLTARGASIDHAKATWRIAVTSGEKRTMTVTVRLGVIPRGTYQVSTAASVYLSHDTTKAPLIGTADADRIPGVSIPGSTASVSAAPREAASRSGTGAVWWSAGTAVVVLAALAAVLRFRHRRRPSNGQRKDRQHPAGNDAEPESTVNEESAAAQKR